MAKQSAANPSKASLNLVREAIFENRTWFMILGAVLIILGIVAVAFPFMTTIAAKKFIGWLFLIGGIFQIIHAFSTQKWGEFFLDLIVGALYVFVGGWLAFFPLTGIVTLTVLLALTFLMQGLLEAGMALRLRPLEGWVWMLIAGIVAMAAGILIIAKLPSSAVWAIGLLVGIKMISSGWAYFFLALAAGKKA